MMSNLKLCRSGLQQRQRSAVLYFAYENCLEKLRAHFLDEREGVEPVVEVKLMVLGNGRVGKTQFCRRLAELPFQPHGNSTHGVARSSPRDCRARAEQDRVANVGFRRPGHLSRHACSLLRDNAIFALIWAQDFERRSQDESDGLIFGNSRLARRDRARNRGAMGRRHGRRDARVRLPIPAPGPDPRDHRRDRLGSRRQRALLARWTLRL